MRALDSIALKYITSQANLNDQIKLNKQLVDQVDTLIEINKELRDKLSIKKR